MITTTLETLTLRLESGDLDINDLTTTQINRSHLLNVMFADAFGVKTHFRIAWKPLATTSSVDHWIIGGDTQGNVGGPVRVYTLHFPESSRRSCCWFQMHPTHFCAA